VLLDIQAFGQDLIDLTPPRLGAVRSGRRKIAASSLNAAARVTERSRGGVVPGRSWHSGLVSLEADQPLLHPLLAARWSPTTFDASYELAASEIEALLEAARWAPSAGNSQPHAFIVGQRGDATHARLVRYLARSSGVWAPAASLLVANLAHRYMWKAPAGSIRSSRCMTSARPSPT